MSEDSKFWLSILVPIPLGVAINLVTPWFRRQLGQSNAKFKERQLRKEKVEAAATEFFASNHSVFALYLIRHATATVIGLIGFIFSYAGAMFVVVAAREELGDVPRYLAQLPFQLISLFFLTVTFFRVRRMSRIWVAVRRREGWPLLHHKQDAKVGVSKE
ncbi:hypothetical protein [Micromonospora globispora]|uniref:hypothetical protein n=1 Tax=Micromonospora globispora TaxID=1450148 RepID=UPI000F50FDF2|nr:hypothetical protein [Micromonospora globispora]